MATLQSIADEVYIITNRPDLVAETKVAIRKAIRKFHGADTFKRDLTVQRIDLTAITPLDPNQYRWSIELAEFLRWRRMKAVLYPGHEVGGRSVEFTEITPDNLFDGYGYERTNYFMIAGNSLNVKAGWYIDKLDFTYYQWPHIPVNTEEPLTSWIAREYPDAVIEEAAGAVFKMIGKDEEFNRFQSLFGENLAILKATDLGENN